MFNDLFKGKKVIITGNSGFKGSWLSLWLNKLGASVHGISYKPPSKLNMFESLNLENKLKSFSKIDIANNPSEVDEIITKIEPDFLFHLAAQPLVSVSYQDPLFTIRTNVLGTANILNSIKNQQHRVVSVIITSDKCYDNLELKRGYDESDILGGKDIYSGSKGAAELVIKSFYHSFFKNHKFNSVIASARAGNVIGGGDWGKDRIVPDAVTSWNKSQKLHIRNPLSTRPWQHVLEPLSGYLTLAYKLYSDDNLNGESFNFGPTTQHSHTVEDILRDMSKYWNFEDPSKAYIITDNVKFHEAGLLKLNCEKALFHLNWIPTLNYEELVHLQDLGILNFMKARLI